MDYFLTLHTGCRSRKQEANKPWGYRTEEHPRPFRNVLTSDSPHELRLPPDLATKNREEDLTAQKLKRNHSILNDMKISIRPRIEHLLLIIDLVGTALFAAEGASIALHAKLDILGILVLAFATALGGGLIRDMLLGDIPPNSIRDWRYPAVALLTGAIVFLLHTSTSEMNHWLLTILDAAGLSFFAVAGATKAIEFKLHPLLATMMGGITAVGGGTIRDLLINQVPSVLRSDVYAAAALLGAAVAVLLLRLKFRPAIASFTGIAACFILRMLAVYNHWNLPGAGT
jgi:uncharacterized membrane protein YeiH